MRRGLVGLAVAAAALAGAPDALALGGGGTAHFFGGGGGGGLGHGLSGVGHGLGGLGRAFGHGRIFFIPLGHGGGGTILLLIALAILVFVVLPRIVIWWRGRRAAGPAARRQIRRRQRRVELAAAEAADDDPAFAPDAVRAAAAELFGAVQRAWDNGDRIALRGLVAPKLLAEWEQRLDDFDRRGWHNRVQVRGEPHIDLVGLRRSDGDGDGRVTVRVEATVRDYVEDRFGRHIHRDDTLSDTVRAREYWTLGRREGHWVLVSIEQGAEGAHALSDEIVATPWSDERHLRDEALVAGAVAEAVPEGTNLAELADLDFAGDARAAANDLSLADGRFAPDVLEVAARRAVQAWVEAVDGSDATLRELAEPDALQALLHPDGPRSRLVVRGLAIGQIRITALDPAALPPALALELELSGRRYLEDRDTTAVLAGDPNREVRFAEHWTLTLNGDEAQPWRLASAAVSLAH